MGKNGEILFKTMSPVRGAKTVYMYLNFIIKGGSFEDFRGEIIVKKVL